ncbi:MAG: response regulator [Bacteroidia bacterium]
MLTLKKNYKENEEPVVTQRGPLVMLVDDCEIDNFVNEKMLKRYGLSDRIMSYENPIHALDYLADTQNEMPAYIFLDLHMPGMEGADFLEKLREMHPGLKNKCEFIVLSNSVDPKLKVNIMSENNVLAFFSKPLIKSNVDEILMKVHKFQAA